MYTKIIVAWSLDRCFCKGWARAYFHYNKTNSCSDIQHNRLENNITCELEEDEVSAAALTARGVNCSYCSGCECTSLRGKLCSHRYSVYYVSKC